ncbi:hypothetical protein [Pseudomonas sp. A-RE-26]|uniref:hypothetical protein n=1 Tax=Pseudomonas sp. A-RE-26 TaxID=2832402 RepID=UPI001CC19811|nr:hypothetical protein [Pseudomonas sp. A-RE-26]
MTNDDDSLIDIQITPSKFPSDFAGQRLFVQGDDWQHNAMLGWTLFPADLYAIGYKDAADGLLQAIVERKASLDSAIYPLVFLYRQALELQLKLMLPLARRLSGEEPLDDHRHELMPLWRTLRRLLEKLDPRPDDEELPAMDSFIQQFQDVDPISFAFRYSTDKKGALSLPDLQHINVRHLSEVLDSVFLMLSGIYSWLDEMEQNPPYN